MNQEDKVRQEIWHIMLKKNDVERDEYVRYMKDFLEVADLKITDIENQEIIEKSTKKETNPLVNIY